MAQLPSNLLDFMRAATAAVTSGKVKGGELAFFDRNWWIQPTPNTLAVQLNWAAIPAYGRYLKFFSGSIKGSLPNDNSYGLQGLGLVPFWGLIYRRLR